MPTESLSTAQLKQIWRRIALVAVGMVIFVVGINPALLGINLSSTIGFAQSGTWLVGLGIVLVGLYACVRVVRAGRPNSLRAEIGVRLIATAFVVAAVASLADYIGIGSHRLPNVSFGPVQVLGLIVGIISSLVGVVLYWPWPKRPDETS